jgi:hypothetical protein
VLLEGSTGPEEDRLSGDRAHDPRCRARDRWSRRLDTPHFFTPWLNVGRIIGLLPMVYAAWWKKSIYVSMAVHVLGNAIPMLFLLAGLLGTGPG